ncbi:MAG: nucleoside hydrolase [Spirochaetaceae bacterium]|jgi:inosine-uridine nucleoside N-ribohydrolase|nr:nucleoside hydrolase [Spirochaetaceae bacterium]
MIFNIPSHESIAEKLRYPLGKLRTVIDTDAYNEVDDQFAIAWALRSPERLAVEAVYAAPYNNAFFFQGRELSEEEKRLAHYAASPADGMEQSYHEIIKLFRLLKMESAGKVFRGSASYIGGAGKAVESEAAQDLVRRAMEGEGLLYVLALGAITNVASAIVMEPKITEKIVVVWLGGQPLSFSSGQEFNLLQDVPAAQILFDSGTPLVLIPCMLAASHLTLTAEEMKTRLWGKSAVGTYLADMVAANFTDALIGNSLGMKKFYLPGLDDIPGDIAEQFPTRHIAWSRIIWDISTVAYVLNPNWSATRLVPSPILGDDMTWKQDRARHPIRYCSYVSRDHIFGDLFAKLAES